MSIENTDDLDAFSDAFHGIEKPVVVVEEKEEAAPVAEEEVVDVDDLEPVVDDDTVAEEVDSEEEEEVAPPKPKKNSFQERIDQLSEKARLERERADALEARLAKLEAPVEDKAVKPVATGEPTPDDVGEDGVAKYPLGEFDPQYAKDLIRFTLDAQLNEQKAEQKRHAELLEFEKAEEKRLAEWNEKLAPAQERYPDYTEKAQGLLETFGGLDEQYGDYLTTTIMQMEFGPDVLYYLSNNLELAKDIVDSGPVGATIALGRLESRYLNAEEEKEKRIRVSNAPPPPPSNKGSAVSVPEVPGDTEDLDAFTDLLFKKSRR